MRAVVIGDVGDASGLTVVERRIPSPGRGQVLVQTEAIGVGGVDAMIRRGRSAGQPSGRWPVVRSPAR